MFGTAAFTFSSLSCTLTFELIWRYSRANARAGGPGESGQGGTASQDRDHCGCGLDRPRAGNRNRRGQGGVALLLLLRQVDAAEQGTRPPGLAAHALPPPRAQTPHLATRSAWKARRDWRGRPCRTEPG